MRKCKKNSFLEKYIFCGTIFKMYDYVSFKANNIKGYGTYAGGSGENSK